MTLKIAQRIVQGLMVVVAVGILVSLANTGTVPLCWAMLGLAVVDVVMSFALRAQARRTNPDRERLR